MVEQCCGTLLELVVGLLVGLAMTTRVSSVASFSPIIATGSKRFASFESCPKTKAATKTTTQLYVFERMSEECVQAIVTAQNTAIRFMLEEVDEACMLVGVADHSETRALERTLKQFGVTYRSVTRALEKNIHDGKDDGSSQSSLGGKWLTGFRAAAKNDNDRPFSLQLKKRFNSAGVLADRMKSTSISSHHILLSLLGYQDLPNDQPTALADDESSSSDYDAWNLLQMIFPTTMDVSALQICESLLANLQDESTKTSIGKKSSGPELVTGVGSGSSNTPTLAEAGTDLTQLAIDGLLDPVHGRDNEIRACVRTLLRRRKNNVVLIGDPGVGKTAIAEGIAQLLVSDQCPAKLMSHRLISLELSALVAGTKYRGEFEERLQSILEEVLDPKAPATILFIDEIHNLVGAGSAEGGMDAANLLKPALARGEMQLIGATTIAEYRKYIEKDGALERRLQPVMVRETTVNQTMGILEALKINYERHHDVTYTNAALFAAASLSERYISDRFLPDKAIDLLDEAGSFAQLKADRDSIPVVDEHVVAEVVSEMTGIPLGKLESTEMDRLLSLEEQMEVRVKGQRRAVRGVARAIRRARSGLRDPKRPVASFMFCGPTGTGKTELCKCLAETYYGAEKDMIRIDMSEYMDKHTVSRLVGSPPGFIGYEEGGQLTEKVRKAPHSVVLLDEIEKAHEDVLNVLLQILEDGALTDGKGRTVNFKNTIVVMTSNLGSRRILDLSKENGGSLGAIPASTALKVNGAGASISSPANAMSPDNVLKRIQSNPNATSLFMKASSDPHIMEGILAAINGSPSDLLEIVQNNPVVAAFLEQLWAAIDVDVAIDRNTPSVNSGLGTIRASMEKSMSQWSESSNSKFAKGLAEELQSFSGDHVLYPRLVHVVKEELLMKLKPELLNRIDEIIVFSPLKRHELTDIASIIINQVLCRARNEQNVKLQVASCLMEEIVREGSVRADQFGARPIRRAVQRFVEDSLSESVIQGFLKKGDEGKLSLWTTNINSYKKHVLLTRNSDGKELVVEVEDGSGGIDGVVLDSDSSFPLDRSNLPIPVEQASASKS